MRIIRQLALPLTLLMSSSAIGQPAPVIAVQLSNFKFTPNMIVLDHGRPYVLRLANVAGGGHDFTAKEFLAAASIAPADRRWVADGEIEVPSHEVREIHLTAPAAGTYKLKCSHTFHKTFGMSGKILVR